MKVYISTCDKYDHLLPGTAYLFNKYWGSHQEVHVLGFRQPSELPDNFIFHSMEPVETLPWSTNMRKFFDGVEDEYFIFMFDDYWFTKPVDIGRVEEMERLLVDDKLEKVDLTMDIYRYGSEPYGEGLWRANQDAFLRLSTQAAIWRKDYWMKWMNPGFDPWGFEIKQRYKEDDGVLVGSDRAICIYSNIYKKGLPDQKSIDKVPKEDREVLVYSLSGRLGKGVYGNVLRSQEEPGRGPEYFEVVDVEITSIMMSRNSESIVVRYDLLNSCGINIHSDYKYFNKKRISDLIDEGYVEKFASLYSLLPEFSGSRLTFSIKRGEWSMKSLWRERKEKKFSNFKTSDVDEVTGMDFKDMVRAVKKKVFKI